MVQTRDSCSVNLTKQASCAMAPRIPLLFMKDRNLRLRPGAHFAHSRRETSVVEFLLRPAMISSNLKGVWPWCFLTLYRTQSAEQDA